MTEYDVYLERLRRSGETNMYGAAPYLVKEFGISVREACDVLVTWMQNYNPEDYAGIDSGEVMTCK